MGTLSGQEFIERARKKHGDRYGYSKVRYVDSKTKVVIECKVHGDFEQVPSSHIRGRGCLRCKKRVGTLEDFIAKAREVHGLRYSYSNAIYKKSLQKVSITCSIHGDFAQTPASHLLGRGCKRCSCTSSIDDFVRKARAVHGDRYDYSLTEFSGCYKKVKIRCHKHGVFEQTTSNHMDGHGCRKCRSNISAMCDAWLDSLGVPDDNEHREVILPIRIGHRRYIADGYGPKTNTVYEFWGDFWHGNPCKYSAEVVNHVVKKTMGELREAKQQKAKKILNAGFKLVEIWESEWLGRCEHG